MHCWVTPCLARHQHSGHASDRCARVVGSEGCSPRGQPVARLQGPRAAGAQHDCRPTTSQASSVLCSMPADSPRSLAPPPKGREPLACEWAQCHPATREREQAARGACTCPAVFVKQTVPSRGAGGPLSVLVPDPGNHRRAVVSPAPGRIAFQTFLKGRSSIVHPEDAEEWIYARPSNGKKCYSVGARPALRGWGQSLHLLSPD